MKMKQAGTRVLFFSLLMALHAFGAGAQEDPAAGATAEAPAYDRGGWPAKLVIAFPAIGTVEETRTRYASLLKFMGTELGIPVEMEITDGYLPIFAGFRAGQMDAAYMGPLSYIELGRYAKVEPAVMEVNAAGQAGYYALLVARADAGLAKLEDARGKVLALVDRDSTSGFLIPSHHFLTALKTSPGAFAGKVVFAGTHDEVIKGVADHRYDLGATNDIDLVRACREQGLSQDKFVVLWKSPLFPASPYAVRLDLPDSLRAAIKNTLLAVNREPAILQDLGIGGFARTDDTAYGPVRELSKILE